MTTLLCLVWLLWVTGCILLAPAPRSRRRPRTMLPHGHRPFFTGLGAANSCVRRLLLHQLYLSGAAGTPSEARSQDDAMLQLEARDRLWSLAQPTGADRDLEFCTATGSLRVTLECEKKPSGAGAGIRHTRLLSRSGRPMSTAARSAMLCAGTPRMTTSRSCSSCALCWPAPACCQPTSWAVTAPPRVRRPATWERDEEEKRGQSTQVAEEQPVVGGTCGAAAQPWLEKGRGRGKGRREETRRTRSDSAAS